MSARRTLQCYFLSYRLNHLCFKWLLGLGVAGQADLYVNGQKFIDNSTDQTPGLLFVSRT